MAGISQARNGRGLTPQSLARALEKAACFNGLEQRYPAAYQRAVDNLHRLQNKAIFDDDAYRCTSLRCTGKRMTGEDLKEIGGLE